MIASLATASLAKPSKPAPLTHAPRFELPTTKDKVSLDSLRGRVVLVDFWASWCVPCRKSFPWLEALHDRYAAQGLVIVAINLDKSRPPADTFLEDFRVPFVVAFDPAGKTAEAFRVKAMPSSFLIGADGIIVHTETGFDPKHTAALEAMVAGALPR